MAKNRAVAFYNTDDEVRWGSEQLPAHVPVIRDLARTSLSREQVLVELGCGKGALRDCHPRYVGMDLSRKALEKHLAGYAVVQADIERVPLRDGCAGLIVSRAVIEHVPEPERVLEEVDRLLAPGGIAYLAPAWFCRTWAAQGLPIRAYRDLDFADKLRKLSIPIRDHIVWRSLFVIPKRAWRSMSFRLRRRPMRFHFVRLTPNHDEYVYTDCDAFSSLDPHMVTLYFQSRGYEILDGRDRLLRQIFHPNRPVLIRKPVGRDVRTAPGAQR